MHHEPHIHVIDTGFQRPRFDACYLVVENGRGAFIDCGTNHSRPRLLDTLAAAGLGVDAVDWLILTHVHLDHAGGAGELMAHLPNARLVVHPRGARHMIDPSKLWAGATAVYGEEEMQRSYGKLHPIPADRVVEAGDGHEVNLGGRILRCLATPGHAKHHNAIHDTGSGCIFSGDTFGLSYRELDSACGPFIIPTTSPVDFDPEALHASVSRLVDLQPPAIYLTHFGPVTDIARLGTDMHQCIDAMVDIAETHANEVHRHEALVRALAALYRTRLQTHLGDTTDAADRLDEAGKLLAIDTELNAQGLEVWLERRRRAD